MFNPDSWQSHTEYHINFKNLKARFPSQLRVFLWDHYSKEREKLMSLNLDSVGEYLSQYYSNTGRPAKNQAQILRSFLLFAMLFNRTDAKLSLTSWVEEVLPKDPVLFALIGCVSVDSLPLLFRFYGPLLGRLQGTLYPFLPSSQGKKWKETKEGFGR